MSDVYRTEMEVRWADLDANKHVRNTAYSEFATHARLRFLASRGFPPERFTKIGVGPIFFREETVFRRELHLGDVVTIEVRADGLARDVSRWRVVHRLLRGEGQEAAWVTVDGAWMDLEARKLMAPPAELADALRSLPHTPEFEPLDSVVD
ncbi:MAG: acyl-CoA thioesterase [Candidatus Longimicrobiales bacterium M2_2A_002]